MSAELRAASCFAARAIGGAKDQISEVAQVISEAWLGKRGFPVGHCWDVLIPLRRERDAVFVHHACGLVAALVIGKPLFDRQPRHADVERVATLRPWVLEAYDIDAMVMSFAFRRFLLLAFTHASWPCDVSVRGAVFYTGAASARTPLRRWMAG